jgi:hypothetical protein
VGIYKLAMEHTRMSGRRGGKVVTSLHHLGKRTQLITGKLYMDIDIIYKCLFLTETNIYMIVV